MIAMRAPLLFEHYKDLFFAAFDDERFRLQ
jgi:hypothetical protein